MTMAAPIPRSSVSPAPSMPAYDATDITGPDGQAQIILGDQVYTLRITRAGKLILTK